MASLVDIVRNAKGTAGAWRVERTVEGGDFQVANLYHYGTRMLKWRISFPEDSSVLDWDLGWASVSDQQGMNRAFMTLGLPYWYSRKHCEILSMHSAEDRAKMPLHFRKWAAAGRYDLLPAGWPRPGLMKVDPPRGMLETVTSPGLHAATARNPEPSRVIACSSEARTVSLENGTRIHAADVLGWYR